MINIYYNSIEKYTMSPAVGLNLNSDNFTLYICSEGDYLKINKKSKNKYTIVRCSGEPDRRNCHFFDTQKSFDVSHKIEEGVFILYINNKSLMVFELNMENIECETLDNVELDIIDIGADFIVFQDLLSPEKYQELDDLLDD